MTKSPQSTELNFIKVQSWVESAIEKSRLFCALRSEQSYFPRVVQADFDK